MLASAETAFLCSNATATRCTWRPWPPSARSRATTKRRKASPEFSLPSISTFLGSDLNSKINHSSISAFLGSFPNSKIWTHLKGEKILLFCGMGETLLSWCRFSSLIMFGVFKRKVQSFQYTMMFIGIYLPLSF